MSHSPLKSFRFSFGHFALLISSVLALPASPGTARAGDLDLDGIYGYLSKVRARNCGIKLDRYKTDPEGYLRLYISVNGDKTNGFSTVLDANGEAQLNRVSERSRTVDVLTWSITETETRGFLPRQKSRETVTFKVDPIGNLISVQFLNEKEKKGIFGSSWEVQSSNTCSER
jgi:hypothetical protein